MNPTVSVIIPNYNHAPFLKERIESVMNQTNQDFEVIILDDCSIDNSREIIEEYRDNPKISHIVYNKKNSGSTFKQWEKGISLAKGEIIWIAESDDIADLDFLATLVPLMELKNADIVYCGSQLIDENSNIIHQDLDIELGKTLNSRNDYNLFNCHDFLKKHMIFTNNIFNASAVVFRKKNWEGISYDFINMRACGDWLCWIRMLMITNFIIWHSKKLNKFRIHSNKVTPNAQKSGLTFIERKNIVDFLFSKDVPKKRLLKAALIGKNYYDILRSPMESEIKKDVRSKWELSYPFPILWMFIFILYRIWNIIKESK